MWAPTKGEERSERSAVLFSLAASLLYGSQFVAIKIGMGDLDPLFFGSMTVADRGVWSPSPTASGRD